MKQYLTLRNVLKYGGVLLGLIAFFFMFGNQLYQGNTQLKFNLALFGDETYKGAVLSFVGYILILLGSAATVVAVFAKGGEKTKKYVALGSAFLMVLGAIFVFVEAAVFNANNAKYYIVDVKLMAFPIIAGVFAILGGGAIVASEFVPDRQLVK